MFEKSHNKNNKQTKVLTEFPLCSSGYFLWQRSITPQILTSPFLFRGQQTSTKAQIKTWFTDNMVSVITTLFFHHHAKAATDN